jgi:hypothetical protein
MEYFETTKDLNEAMILAGKNLVLAMDELDANLQGAFWQRREDKTWALYLLSPDHKEAEKKQAFENLIVKATETLSDEELIPIEMMVVTTDHDSAVSFVRFVVETDEGVHALELQEKLGGSSEYNGTKAHIYRMMRETCSHRLSNNLSR